VTLPWSWGSKITEQLLWDGLQSVRHLFLGTVLDLGCGTKPYRKMIDGGVSRWVGLDLPITPSGRSAANVFGSGLDLPFGTATFDTVLSTQVLEHVARPAALILEAQRVLKPGGHLVLTAPQTNPLHEEPNDYFRYTCYGLRALTEQAGLCVVEVRPLGGAIATVAQMIVWHMNWPRRIPVVGSIIANWMNAYCAWTALKLDRLSVIYGGGAMKDTLNWLLIARKPEQC
jgi:SAM-dependent methyltransferase